MIDPPDDPIEPGPGGFIPGLDSGDGKGDGDGDGDGDNPETLQFYDLDTM